MVEIIQADYKKNQEELLVKARTSIAGCSLTLVGFGPMTPEGEHWVLTVEDMDEEDVPATVTVLSSCGGSASSPVN